MRIAISTGGGDAPGLNAVIRAAVLSAADHGWDVLGIKRGFAGLMGEDEVIPMTRETVRGIAHLGGTILRTTNRGNPFHYPRVQPDGSIVSEDRSDELIENAARLGIDAIISIGGDGSLVIAQRLCDKGMKIVGVPKTIDNDVSGTITTFGFDTAVNTAMEAIDKLHTTAESHDRVIVMEVMGRDAGFIALHSGVAGTADVILIPEIPYDIEKVCEKIDARDRGGRHFSIVVVAEGRVSEGRNDVDARRVAAGGGAAHRRAVRADRAGDPGAHREGDTLARARSSPARRHADRLRPFARDAFWRRRRARGRGREVGAHGGAPVAAHRDDSDQGSFARTQARRSHARFGADSARDGYQFRRLNAVF